jgi:hypothetical protein
MSLYDDIIKQAQGSPKADAEKYVDSLLKKPSPPFKGFTPSLKIPQEFRAAEKKNMQQNAATLEKPKLTAVNVADPFFKGWEQGNLMLADFAFNNPLNPVSGIYKEMKDITGVDAVEAAKAPIYERLNAYQQRIDDAGKLGDGYKTYATIAEGVGMAAPNAIVALTTGGSSLAGTTEGLAANAATQAARGAGGLSGSLRGAAETARQAVIRMPQDPNYITAYAQSFGADYEQAIQSGATEEQAQATATISALINAAIEQKGIQALPSALRGKNSKAITQWVKTMIDEGNEEVLQGVVSNLTAKIGYNPSAPISSTTDPNAVLNLGRAAQEFGMGATVGGILGGGQVLTNQFTPKAPASRATQASVQAAPATIDAPAVAPAATQSVAETFETRYQNDAAAQREIVARLEQAESAARANFSAAYSQIRGLENVSPELQTQSDNLEAQLRQAEQATKAAKDRLSEIESAYAAETSRIEGEKQIVSLASRFNDRFITGDALKNMEQIGYMKPEVSALRKAFDKASDLQNRLNRLRAQYETIRLQNINTRISGNIPGVMEKMRGNIEKLSGELDRASANLMSAQYRVANYTPQEAAPSVLAQSAVPASETPARNAQPAQGGITFAPGSVGALLLPEGMGAASRGSLGGIGRTQATRFEVNDQQGITELPPMSNQVNLNPQATSGGFKSALSNAYTQVVDSLNPIVKFSNATGDNTAMMASNSRNANGTVTYIFDKALVDMNGNRIGESLTDVMSRIPKNNQADFWNYMLQRHNVNRAVVDKNVIANYNSQMSQQYVNDAEARHPEYKQAGDDIVKWIDAFNRAWGVESGVIDAAVYENLRNQYTSYIPTQREFSEVEQALTGGSVGQKFVDNQSPMRTATGSARDINNPVENIMRLVNTTVKTARYNQVGQSLLNTVRANPGMTAQYAEIITPEEAELSRGKNIVSVLEGGKEVYLRINDKSLLESLEGLPKSTKAIPVIPQLTNIYKGLITQKNPFFAVRNFARDLPTGYIYGSENNPLKYLKGEAQAFKDIATNSPEYQRFKAIGGGMSGFFSTEQAKVEKAAVNLLKEKNILQKTAATLEKFNSAIEEATRLNEFNTVYNSTGDVQKALNAANNVTVNFARGGNITKTLDKNGVAYLNASVQGLDRLVKSFRTPKTAIATLMKGGLSITAPTIALFLLNWKNPYYADLTDRTKDAYYLIPNILGERDKAGNAETFIKIPKSREFGVLFGSLFERTMRAVSGDEDAFKGFGNTITTNFAPSNPFENNLFAPAVINLKANKDFAGRTIVPQNLQDRSPYLQYDEKTSELSKFIAGLTKGTSFELSPKQLDYLIDSYSGVIGDFLLPATTKGGNVGKVITNQFTADSVYSSQSMTDFYDNMKKAETAVADQKVVGSAYPEKQTVEEKIVNAYTRASKDISALGKISTRAGAGLLTADDRALLKEFGIDATLDSSDLQRAVREEQIQIAEDADALAGRANEKELDAYNGKATPTAFEKYVGAGLSETQAHALYEAIEAIVPEPGKSSASVQQKVSTILSQNLSGKQTAALVASLYTTRDSDGNVKAESLLPSLNNADRLIQLYSSTGESEFISMTVPAEFSQNKQTYTLTDSEKRVFKDAYIRFFNNRITALSTEKQIKKLRDTAYETAKIAVIKSRN